MIEISTRIGGEMFGRAQPAHSPQPADAFAYLESIVDTVREPLIVLSKQLRVKTANRSFYRTFQVTPAQTETCCIYDLGNGQWNIPRQAGKRHSIGKKDQQQAVYANRLRVYEVPPRTARGFSPVSARDCGEFAGG